MKQLTITRPDLVCDGKRLIAVSCNEYNEIDCMPNFLESVKNYPLVIIVDGKWARLEDPDARPDGLSYDGTRELCMKYPNVVLLDCGNQNEEAMSNMCMKVAAMYGYPYLLQVASDEFVRGNYHKFQKNCQIMAEAYPNQHTFFVKFDVIHITPPEQKYQEVMRLIVDPMFVRLRDIHWIYYFNDKPILTSGPTFSPKKYLIDGVIIYHDDSMRNPKREAPMLEYQMKNVPRENKLRWKKFINGEFDEKLDILDIEVIKMFFKDRTVAWWVTPDDKKVYRVNGEVTNEEIITFRARFKCEIWRNRDFVTILPKFEPKDPFPEPCTKCGGACAEVKGKKLIPCPVCGGRGTL